MARILITGTSKGIGYETTLLLARAGHEVVATMRNPAASDLEKVAAKTKFPVTVHAFFTNPEKPEASPTLVGEMIRYVIESGDPRLRFPVGPDAHPFLGWRSALSDEDWVALGGMRNPEYFERVLTDTGIDLRSV